MICFKVILIFQKYIKHPKGIIIKISIWLRRSTFINRINSHIKYKMVKLYKRYKAKRVFIIIDGYLNIIKSKE